MKYEFAAAVFHSCESAPEGNYTALCALDRGADSYARFDEKETVGKRWRFLEESTDEGGIRVAVHAYLLRASVGFGPGPAEFAVRRWRTYANVFRRALSRR